MKRDSSSEHNFLCPILPSFSIDQFLHLSLNEILELVGACLLDCIAFIMC
jgi:hypothetical protein